MARGRLESIDALRGIVMVVMVLDHSRDFFGVRRDPTDLTTTTPVLFFTRWVTHFCAPTFMLLAGTSAYLWMDAGGHSRRELSGFLASRGLWLMFLEVAIVRIAWWPSVVPHVIPLQVIWALGLSMMALSLMVLLPVKVVGAVGLLMIATHDLLDNIHASSFGGLAPAWSVLHESGGIPLGTSVRAYVAYPLVPWVGVMAAGYALGPVVLSDAPGRRRRLATLGGALVVLFLLVRGANVYGDAKPWSLQGSLVVTVMSFLKCSKYPPSLAYLAMTLGPALLLLSLLDRPLGPLMRRFVVIGRVPLFFYVAHLFLLRLGAIALDAIVHGSPGPALVHGGLNGLAADYGYSLSSVYVVWLAAIFILYPPSVWFAGVKAAHRGARWVSYV